MLRVRILSAHDTEHCVLCFGNTNKKENFYYANYLLLPIFTTIKLTTRLYMKRIDFMQFSAFAAAAISFPLLQSCSPSAGEHILSQPVFLSRLFDKKTISEAGKAYLQKTAAENDDDKLIQL